MSSQEQGADATTDRWITIPRVLCFVRNGDNILLMKRSPDRRVFPNRYNGLGGHIERNEDPLTAVIREVKEESGLDIFDVRLRSIHNIDVGQKNGIIMFVFTAHASSQDFESDDREGTLHWVPSADLHHLDLVEDLPYILPTILSMNDDAPPLFVHVSYDGNDQIQIVPATMLTKTHNE